ncbi:MAG: hypothetical protein AAB354_16005 [candidate division KSB1 bacterium]
MNPGQKLMVELSARQLGLNKGSPESRFTHEQEVDGIHLKLEIQDTDKYGFLVRSIAARSTPLTHTTNDLKALLTRQAAELEKRLTYLLENFRLLELDETKQVAQVRSHAPYRQDGAMHYYEILLAEGNALSFARYHYRGAHSQRETEPTYITKEALMRLVSDFAGVLRAA